jgi:hypothetical protein
MLNVKALSGALALTAVLTFIFNVIFGLMLPAGYGAGPAWGSWLPLFHGISFGQFLAGLVGAALLGGLIGYAVASLNNFFHRRWEAAH